MLQFYFLSIVLNALAGYILFAGDNAVELKCGFSLKDETAKLLVGILSLITGVMKILSVIEGDVPVIGDLIPAAAGLLCGFVLLVEFYKSRTSMDDSEEETAGKFQKFLIANKKVLGATAIITAFLHFIFPRVMLL